MSLPLRDWARKRPSSRIAASGGFEPFSDLDCLRSIRNSEEELAAAFNGIAKRCCKVAKPIRTLENQMCRSTLILPLAIAILGGPASSQPLLEEAKAFNPSSETAMAITGPVILSTERMVFETGGFLDLEVHDPKSSGNWGASGDVSVARVFRVSGDAGPLRQGNTLCGDQPITYMAAWREENSGFSYLGVAMFTGMEPPAGIADQALCATYFFSRDVTE